jgi:hypothetical protein
MRSVAPVNVDGFAVDFIDPVAVLADLSATVSAGNDVNH